MPLYRVTLAKPTFNITARDVFRPNLINEPGETSIREWEIEAEDIHEIKDFLKEAYEQDLPNVRGYSLRSILEVKQDA